MHTQQLRSQLEMLANKFVSGLLAAMRSTELGELADQTSRQEATSPMRDTARSRVSALSTGSPRAAGSRRKRASAEEVERQKNVALSTAKTLTPGFSKGDLMKRAGSSVDLGRALSLLVDDGKLTRKGDRRMARYWVK